jgi:hypothetical protein
MRRARSDLSGFHSLEIRVSGAEKSNDFSAIEPRFAAFGFPFRAELAFSQNCGTLSNHARPTFKRIRLQARALVAKTRLFADFLFTVRNWLFLFERDDGAGFSDGPDSRQTEK